MEYGSGRAFGGLSRYGVGKPGINRARRTGLAVAALCALFGAAPLAVAAPTTILAFGDSLLAGYGVGQSENIPARLEQALKAAGRDVRIVNGSVSGDTTADGLARLDWSLADRPDLILVELGANDALRELDPDRARANLDQILTRLQSAHIPVVLCGMLAPRNLGPAYAAKFDPIYPELARKFGATLYPFILDGVALDPALNQPDGIHPNPKGVEVVVGRLLPVVESALARLGG